LKTTTTRLGAFVNRTVGGELSKQGGILAALRRLPLVGADLNLIRLLEEERRVGSHNPPRGQE
jgi:hypothetical protein